MILIVIKHSFTQIKYESHEAAQRWFQEPGNFAPKAAKTETNLSKIGRVPSGR